ncbi:MAG: hypothetical protein MUC85_12865 [Anaerolineales bacterium]|nr:hypothetical protein [Anaerolineales bacterium]
MPGWLTTRRGYRLPAVGGMLMALAGFLLMRGWQMDTPYAVMLPHLAMAGIGFGLVMAPIAAAAINAAPAGERGTASGMVIIFRLVGMTIGVSGIAAYGVQRADRLSQTLVDSSSSLSQVVQAGMQVAEQVINIYNCGRFRSLVDPANYLANNPPPRKEPP